VGSAARTREGNRVLLAGEEVRLAGGRQKARRTLGRARLQQRRRLKFALSNILRYGYADGRDRKATKDEGDEGGRLSHNRPLCCRTEPWTRPQKLRRCFTEVPFLPPFGSKEDRGTLPQ